MSLDAERYLVPGLVRGIEILRLFNRERNRISAPQMARELGIPRSTVFRIAQTLEHLNLLQRDEANYYSLGSAILGFGFEYIAGLEPVDVGREDLEQLRDVTGCSAHMVIRDGVDVVVVLKAAGFATFSGSLDIGTRLPAYATVLGRATLTDMDTCQLTEIFKGVNFQRFTGKSPVDVWQLGVLLQRDRAQGCAISRFSFEEGVSSVAAPVRDHSGQVVTAINVTLFGNAPIPDELIGQVKNCAASISHRLHYRDTNMRATS